jgi:hypothetical protein
VSRQIGLRGAKQNHCPRLHDFRHCSGTGIIPSTDNQDGLLREDTRLWTHRWRHNQSGFRKAKTESRRCRK